MTHLKLSSFCCFLLFYLSCKGQQADIYDTKNFSQVDSVYNAGQIYKRIYKSKLDSSISYSDHYDTQGRVISRLFLKNGKGNGPYYLYHTNGLVNVMGIVKDGRKEEGEWLNFDEKGKLIQKSYYRNGLEEGEWLIYDSMGNVIKKEYYKNGKLIRSIKLTSN